TAPPPAARVTVKILLSAHHARPCVSSRFLSGACEYCSRERSGSGNEHKRARKIAGFKGETDARSDDRWRAFHGPADHRSPARWDSGVHFYCARKMARSGPGRLELREQLQPGEN